MDGAEALSFEVADNDLYGIAERILRCFYYIATVSAIGQYGLEWNTQFLKNPHEQVSSLTVGHVCYCHPHGNKETILIHNHMPFYPFDFLVAVNAV